MKTRMEQHHKQEQQEQQEQEQTGSWGLIIGHFISTFVGAWIFAVIGLWTTGVGVTYPMLFVISAVVSFTINKEDRQFIFNKLK